MAQKAILFWKTQMPLCAVNLVTFPSLMHLGFLKSPGITLPLKGLRRR